jgi:hypothetical protein
MAYLFQLSQLYLGGDVSDRAHSSDNIHLQDIELRHQEFFRRPVGIHRETCPLRLGQEPRTYEFLIQHEVISQLKNVVLEKQRAQSTSWKYWQSVQSEFD